VWGKARRVSVGYRCIAVSTSAGRVCARAVLLVGARLGRGGESRLHFLILFFFFPS